MFWVQVSNDAMRRKQPLAGHKKKLIASVVSQYENLVATVCGAPLSRKENQALSRLTGNTTWRVLKTENGMQILWLRPLSRTKAKQ